MLHRKRCILSSVSTICGEDSMKVLREYSKLFKDPILSKIRLPLHSEALVDKEFPIDNRNCYRMDVNMRSVDDTLAANGLLLEDLRHIDIRSDSFVSLEQLRSELYGSSNFPILRSCFIDDESLTGFRRQYLIERSVQTQSIEIFRSITSSMLGLGLMANVGDSFIRKTWTNWIDALTARLQSNFDSSKAHYASSIRGSRESMRAISLLSSLNLSPDILAKISCIAFTSEVCNPSPGKSSVTTGRGSNGDDEAFSAHMRNWTTMDIESSIDSSVSGKALFIHLCDTVASALMFESNYRNKKKSLVMWDQEEKFTVGAEVIRMILSECFVQSKSSSHQAGGTLKPSPVMDPDRDLYSEPDLPAQSPAHAPPPLATHVHAFRHVVERRGFKSSGYIVMDPVLAKNFAAVMPSSSFFKLPPMIVPPAKWMSFWRCGFMTRRLPLIRYTGTRDSSRDARVSDFSHIRDCMDYLGSTSWVVCKDILSSMEEAVILADSGEKRLDIPGIASLVERTPNKTAASRGLGRRTDLLEQLRDKQKQENQRPILLSKLRVARDMQNAHAIYFPHSIDFRGRAYPIPAPFNHQGDDICRSLLRFSEKKRLGERGWFWLRVHAANIFGIDKVRFEQRLEWVEENLQNIVMFANNPFCVESLKFVGSHTDDFWQALSVSREVRDAIGCGSDPTNFESNLPIHQDGSCNGLQHYAALGRDEFGARAVNIVPNENVEDVYTVVLDIVKERIRSDADQGGSLECPSSFADLKSGTGVPALGRVALESDILHRKTVKQTVMTICYGVTQIGASDQVNKQLKDLPIAKNLSSAQLAVLSSYIAKTILASIDTVFKQAMEIKRWFDTVAAEMNKHEIPIAWISPAGVVCRQPYRKQQVTEIRTLVQKITITDDAGYDRAPISPAKQRLGFPPNFVHSLDASHMIMTAKGCEKAGLTFAAVHDSYWTHACDVDTMNRIIREEFYKMYSEPILERLRNSLVTRLGEQGDKIPPLPKQGDLDLKCVLESPFFFD